MITATLLGFVYLTVSTASPQHGDQRQIVFMSRRDGNAEIYIVHPADATQKRLTSNPTNDLFPTGSPDGRSIAYLAPSTTKRGFALWVMKTDGSQKKELQPAPAQANSFCWSPDSTKIAMENGIVTVDVPTKTSPTTLRMYRPAWSPDGTKIAFKSPLQNTASRKRAFCLYVINAEGGEPQQVAEAIRTEARLAWSPDSTRIAFMASREHKASDIHVVSVDGTGEKNLTNAPFNDRAPCWSADGSKILWLHGTRRGSDELWVMNPDGTDQHQARETLGTWVDCWGRPVGSQN